MAVCKHHIPCGGKFTAFRTKIGGFYLGCLIPCEWKNCRRAAIGKAS